jgi:hypothetical protein
MPKLLLTLAARTGGAVGENASPKIFSAVIPRALWKSFGFVALFSKGVENRNTISTPVSY